jgi:hypothetical protein
MYHPADVQVEKESHDEIWRKQLSRQTNATIASIATRLVRSGFNLTEAELSIAAQSVRCFSRPHSFTKRPRTSCRDATRAGCRTKPTWKRCAGGVVVYPGTRDCDGGRGHRWTTAISRVAVGPVCDGERAGQKRDIGRDFSAPVAVDGVPDARGVPYEAVIVKSLRGERVYSMR